MDNTNEEKKSPEITRTGLSEEQFQEVQQIQQQSDARMRDISSQDLAPQPTSPDFVQSEPTKPPIPEVEFKPTEKESEISQQIQDIMKLSEETEGKEAFRQEQREAKGLGALESEEADLFAQISQLKAEFQNVENQIQIESEGRGRTAAGVKPLTISRQREISIKANTAAALLAGVQGKILTAQRHIDDAVQAKYGDLEAEIATKKANLELMLADPVLAVQQGERARKQLAAQTREENRIREQKDNTVTIMNWALEARQNGATPEQAQQLADLALKGDPSIEKAFSIFSKFAVPPAEPVTDTTQLTGDVGQFYQAQALGLVPESMSFLTFLKARKDAERAPESVGARGLTPLQLFDRELKLANNFEKVTADARDARRQQNQMEAGLIQAKERIRAGESVNAASQAVLVTFQKVLDPTSVVRESEYARSGSGQSLIGRLEGFSQKITAGGAGITVEDLGQFVELGREFMKGYEQSTLNQAKLIKNQADSIGANLENILPPDALSVLNKPKSVQIGDQQYMVGDIIINKSGEKAVVLSNGELELID